MKLPLLPLVVLTLTGPALHAAIVQFTNPTDFKAKLQPGFFFSDFSDLTPGDQAVTTLSFSAGTPALPLAVASRDASNSGPGDNLWVADLGDLDHALGTATTFSDQLRLSASPFYAIGGDWFLGDIDDNYLPGTVTLSFSDGTVFTVTSTSRDEAFRGFISDSPLTELLIQPPLPNLSGGWVTVDNLVVGTPVPETGSALLPGLAALALAGFGGAFRRLRPSSPPVTPSPVARVASKSAHPA